MTEHFVSGLFVRCAGAGASTILFVHGGPEWDHSYLLPAAERLAGARRVVLFDLRGCGRSFRCDEVEGYTRAAAAGDILTLAETLEPPIDLLGFSFGGRLAMHAAERDPARFRSLILASTSTTAELAWDPEPAERARRRARVEPAVEEAAAAHRGAERTRQMALAGLPLDVGDERRVAEIAPVIERIAFSDAWSEAWEAGVLAAEKPVDESFLCAGLLPVLVIHGARDYRFPLSGSAWLEGSPGVRRIALAGAGHLAHLERPRAWASAVAAFLRELDQKSSRSQTS